MNETPLTINETHTPVVLLGCKLGALAIMRSLGSQGIEIYGVDDDPNSPALRSRYLTKKHIKAYQPDDPDDYLNFIIELGAAQPTAPILIPTSDELSELVAENRETLKVYFNFLAFRTSAMILDI